MADNMYQYYLSQEEKCIENALSVKDNLLFIFYARAAAGFHKKALAASPVGASANTHKYILMEALYE